MQLCIGIYFCCWIKMMIEFVGNKAWYKVRLNFVMINLQSDHIHRRVVRVEDLWKVVGSSPATMALYAGKLAISDGGWESSIGIFQERWWCKIDEIMLKKSVKLMKMNKLAIRVQLAWQTTVYIQCHAFLWRFIILLFSCLILPRSSCSKMCFFLCVESVKN